MKVIGDEINGKRPIFEVNKPMTYEGEDTIVTTLCWERKSGNDWKNTGKCDTIFLDEIPVKDVKMILIEYLKEEIKGFNSEKYNLEMV